MPLPNMWQGVEPRDTYAETRDDKPYVGDSVEALDSPERHSSTPRDEDGKPVLTTGQDGVKKAQATTIAWSRKALLLVYAL